MEIEYRIVAALHLLPRDRRLNTLVAEVAAKVGIRDIYSVADLIAELEVAPPAVTPMWQPQSIMVGGALTASKKMKLFIVCVILIYLASVFGLFRLAEDLRIIATGAVGGIAFLPELFRFSRRLFKERRLFVAHPLEYDRVLGTLHALPMHVVRLEFDPLTNYLLYDGSNQINYSTIVTPYVEDIMGFIPTLNGMLFFNMLNVKYRVAGIINMHYLPKLEDGIIVSGRQPNNYSQDMRLKEMYALQYSYLEEQLAGRDLAELYVTGNPQRPHGREGFWHDRAFELFGAAAQPLPWPVLVEPNINNPATLASLPECNVLVGTEDAYSLEEIQEGDVLVNFTYDPEHHRLYNCDSRVGQVIRLLSYNAQPDSMKRRYLQSNINPESLQMMRAHIIQVGGRRKTRSTRRRKIRRITIRR